MFEQLLIRADVLVLVTAAALYLFDSGRLLFADEVLLAGGFSSNWDAVTPASGVRINRRHAVFPKLLSPGSLSLRFLWSSPDPGDSPRLVASKSAIDEKLSPLFLPRAFCSMLLPEIFLGIPIAYLLPNNDWPILALILLIYTQVFIMVAWLFWSRRKLGLTWSFASLLAFESLICIPFAIGFHRKVAENLIAAPATGLLDYSKALLPAAQRQTLYDYVCNAIDVRKQQGASSQAALEKLEQIEAAYKSGMEEGIRA